jgi:hypothetical protein
MTLDRLTFPVVQISLDLTSLGEALDTAAIAVDAGVDWLEAGTPLLLAEGLREPRLRGGTKARGFVHARRALEQTEQPGVVHVRVMKGAANVITLLAT